MEDDKTSLAERIKDTTIPLSQPFLFWYTAGVVAGIAGKNANPLIIPAGIALKHSLKYIRESYPLPRELAGYAGYGLGVATVYFNETISFIEKIIQ